MGQRKTIFEKLAKAKIDRDLAEAKYKELCAVAREELDMGSNVEDDVEVRLDRNRTFNKKRALKEYGDRICSMQPDLKVAKYELSGKELDELYDEGDARVMVKIL